MRIFVHQLNTDPKTTSFIPMLGKVISTVLLIFLTASLLAQSEDASSDYSEYRALRAAEILLDRGERKRALRQAKAAEKLALEQGDQYLEALALRLQADILQEQPQAEATQRVEVAKLLQQSTLILQELGYDSLVNYTLDQLWEVSDQIDPAFARARSGFLSKKPGRKQSQLDSLALANETMAAILAAQESALEALSEQQVRQLLIINEKDRLLDSLAINQLQDSLLLAQQDLLLERSDNELTEERARRNFLLFIAAVVALIALAIYGRFRSGKRYQARLEEKNQAIEKERQRSDELLLNILPATIAEELKQKGAADARYYHSVSVLFTDFVNFSEYSHQKKPAELVAALDAAFRAFDKIVAHYQLEKIKTIGDAYMCAGGLPEPSKDHAIRTVRAARDMREWLRQNSHFQVRIGIHAGPVVAGVVGSHKFAYDIWGDTVNLAARLEANSAPGKINVSAEFRELITKEFDVESRGSIPLKGMGEVEMYYVKA